MSALDLKNQLVFYRSYHTNDVNVRIHLLCIPLILTSAASLFAPLAPLPPLVNLGTLLVGSFSIYYIVLDWKVGIPTSLVYGGYAAAFSLKYHSSSPEVQTILWRSALAVHIVAWLAQFYGHKFHEHRAPALLDNLLQALVLAPYFVAFEVAFALGFRRDIEDYMNRGATIKRREFFQQRAKRS